MKQMITDKCDAPNSGDLCINTLTGEAYISQRKAANILGVPNTTLQYYLENILSRARNIDIKQGLISEVFAYSVQYFLIQTK